MAVAYSCNSSLKNPAPNRLEQQHVMSHIRTSRATYHDDDNTKWRARRVAGNILHSATEPQIQNITFTH